MATSYTENPSNMADIMSYIMTDKTSCAQEMILAQRCFFYDTCAFRKHVDLAHPEYLFDFIKRKNGIIIIVRTIIMELASESQSLNPEYVDYIRKMYQAGLKVLVIYEEEIFDLLNQCFTSNAQINKFLDVAVKVAKNATGTISGVLKTDSLLRAAIMSSNNTDRSLFSRFFCTIRGNKVSGDSLGEEMIAICGHMLANVPETQDYKYIVMTEDKGAVRLINKTQKNVWDYLGKKTITAVTTVALAQKIYLENIISTKNQVEEIVGTDIVNGIVKIVATEEYDLELQEKLMTCSDVADKIVTPNAIHIYY